jgi:O-antigen/teichoic acid export membrane protein
MTLPDPSQPTSHEIGKKVARNAGWNYLSFGLSKGLNLVTLSILAHLLTPELFTVVGLATLAIDYLSILNDFGLGAALVHRRDRIEEASNVVFTFNLLIALSLTGMMLVAAPYVAMLFKEPAITPILRWLGFSFTINALGSVHRFRLQRDMGFSKKLIPDMGNTLIKGALSIGCALLGFGAWSLVYGQLAGMTVATILFWVVVPWRPRFLFDFNLAKQLFRYGFSIMTDRAFTIFGDSFDYLLIGLYYYQDKAALGLYTLAYRLPDLLIINTLSVLAVVFFPAFSSIQNEQDLLRKSFLSSLRYVQLLITPLCLGMLVAADPIIRVIFGEQWLQSIPLMQVLSLYALVLSIGFHVGDIYKAIGRPDILLKLSIPILVVRLIALWIGSQYSLMGIAIGHLVAASIELVIRAIVTTRVIKVTLFDMLKQLTAFISGIALLVFAIPALYLARDAAPLIQLAVVSIAGAVGYLGAAWFIERDAVLKGLKFLRIAPKTTPKVSES